MQIYTHLEQNYGTTLIFFRQSFSINYYLLFVLYPTRDKFSSILSRMDINS